jgi:hypothetical protein
MQFQFEREMGTIRLRFMVEDPDALFHEYRQRGVECTPNRVCESWTIRLHRNILAAIDRPLAAKPLALAPKTIPLWKESLCASEQDVGRRVQKKLLEPNLLILKMFERREKALFYAVEGLEADWNSRNGCRASNRNHRPASSTSTGACTTMRCTA